MNIFEQTLYSDLMKVVSDNEMFFFKDQEQDGVIYRMFGYHIGSYTQFMLPNALECRGVMFRMDGDDADELVSLPYQKFFNLHENPSVMNLDLSTIEWFEEKADGSMIQSFLHNNNLRLKTKGSMSSIMAVDAMAWLNNPDQGYLHAAIEYIEQRGFTVLGEWCDPKPESRIVMFYEEPQLRIFGIRNRMTGEIIDYRSDDVEYLIDTGLIEYADDMSILNTIKLKSVGRKKVDDPAKYLETVQEETGIEGYLLVWPDGKRVKIKTRWYSTQHKLKDSVTNEKALFCAVIAGSSDDLKSVFHDNQGAVDAINAMEEYALPIYAKFVADVEKFYQDNAGLERKDYAILGQKILSGEQFHVAMSLYLGKEVNFADTLIKHASMYVANYTGTIVEQAEE